jgi:hypothetical protein
MSREAQVLELLERLTPRDVAILESLRAHRLASSVQLRRLHFPGPFTTTVAASRAVIRVLNRLERHRLIERLERRIGGARKGSASLVWQLGATGERLLATKHGEKPRRYLEPGGGFVRHTLAVTELAVQLHEALHGGQLSGLTLTPEPANWHRFLGQHGRSETLKPDLHAVTTSGDFEDHWYLERDRSTEHLPVIARKAQTYERYARTGRYQADHDVFPAVLWVVNDTTRRDRIARTLATTPGLTPGIQRAVLLSDFLPTVLSGSDPGNDFKAGP